MPKKQDDNVDVAKVKLTNVRLSFPSLFTPSSFKGSKPAYSGTFLLNKVKDKRQILKVKKVIAEVAKAEWKTKVPKRLETPLRDGDEKEDLDGYGEDVMFITGRSYDPIPIIDAARNTLTEDDRKIYSGCYVHVVLRIWAQDNEWGKRINCSLQALMFSKDGERFAGGEVVDAEEEFADLLEEAEDNALGDEGDEGDEGDDDLLG